MTAEFTVTLSVHTNTGNAENVHHLITDILESPGTSAEVGMFMDSHIGKSGYINIVSVDPA